MNFFGHSVIARARGDAAFVVGAMLPDFASMLRLRVPASTHQDVAAGIAFHHATDEAFHDAPWFHRTSAAAFAALQAAGMERGSARAIAHIGVEMLLDRALASDAAHRAAYLAAIAHAPAFAAVAWARPEEPARVEELRRALVTHGVDWHDCEPVVIAERLQRVLARRPRLAFAPAQLPIVIDWIARTDRQVASTADEILAYVRAALA